MTGWPATDRIGGPAPYWNTYTYDEATGLRKTETLHAVPGSAVSSGIVRTYNYGAPLGSSGLESPHALQSVSESSAGTTTNLGYTYDQTGNTISRPDGQTMAWDDEGRLTPVSGDGFQNGTYRLTNRTSRKCLDVTNNATTDSANAVQQTCWNTDRFQQWKLRSAASYIYDAGGNRLISKDASGATLHLPGQEVKIKYTNAAQTTPVKSAVRYYSHAGQVVAYRTGTASTSLYFLMPDYQGTGDITVNAVDQTQYSQRWFEPFGAERVPNTDTGIWPFLADKGFVGGTKDPTGLTRLGAREYDTETGRFTSVDPVFNSSDPNSWTNYGYADENPVNNADAQGTLCYPVHTDQGTKTECLGPYGDSHPDNGETTTPPPPSTPNYTPSAPSAPPVEKKCGTWDFKCKAAKVWSEHKATIVSTAVGPGCGAVVGWTGVGAVGCGALAGTVHNLTVAADHTYYVLAGNTPVLVHNCTVYRGDQRSPAEIADAGGFRPKGGTSDLKEYVSSKLPSVFVSTTKKLSRAIPFTMSNKGGMTGYIYRIDGAPGGIDANKTIGLRRMMRNGFPGEREIAFEGGIESQFITACRKYVGGSPVGDWMPFP